MVRLMRLGFVITVLIAGVAACADNDGDNTLNEVRVTSTSSDAVPQAAEATPTEEQAVAPTATATTVEPTATDEATSTPMATATAEATPADLQIGKWRAYSSEYGSSYYVVGEIINQGETGAQNINLVVSFYDSAGTLVASSDVAQTVPIVTAGGKTPFIVTTLDFSPENVAETRFQVQFDPYDEDSYTAEVTVTNFETVQLNWGEDRITGEILNASDVGVRFVSVMVIGYTENGEIAGVERTMLDLNPVGPGVSAPFDIRYSKTEINGMPTTVEAFAYGHIDS